MADTGWLDPGLAQMHGGGAVVWSNDTNAAGEDGTVATSNTINGNGETTAGLECTNFNASLPVGATVNGVEARIKRAYDSGASTDPACDALLLLVVGGSPEGADYADTGTGWPADTLGWSATYGGAADVWSTSIDRAAVNSPDFGVILTAQCFGGLGSYTVALVDAIQLKVYYTEAGGGKPAQYYQMMRNG